MKKHKKIEKIKIFAIIIKEVKNKLTQIKLYGFDFRCNISSLNFEIKSLKNVD